MTKNTRRTQRGESSLTRERIVAAAVALLDNSGAAGLTFRALADALATGAGALYFHVANKDELMHATCDAIVAPVMATASVGATPQERLRSIGLGIFEAFDAHPWAGAVLADAPGTMPTIRILEGIGQQVQALGLPDAALWRGTSALYSYIVGVAGQNAANALLGQARGLDRSTFLSDMAARWSQLDAAAFPFTRGMAAQFPDHDDRDDFLAGIDLIVAGIAAQTA